MTAAAGEVTGHGQNRPGNCGNALTSSLNRRVFLYAEAARLALCKSGETRRIEAIVSISVRAWPRQPIRHERLRASANNRAYL
jgi:hypothetical protein